MSETNGNGKWPLPEGWVWTTLGDVCSINMGQSPPSETYNTEGVGLPFFQGKAEFGPLYPTTVKWCSKPQKISESGDILLSVRAPVGSTNLNREKSCIGRGLAAITIPEQMNNLYFLYYLRYSEQDLIDQATGTTFQAVSGKVVRNHSIPLAPHLVQHRIVAEIEKQFTRLDAAVAALKRAKANLARYKAAVLKAAVEGRLVPQDPNDEPAAALLERILAERRAQWEAANPKKKYVEPKRPNVDGLPALPVGWVWATLEQLTSENRPICYGILMPKEHVPDGVLYVKVKDIQNNRVNVSGLMRTSHEIAKKYARASLKTGDLLLSIRGTYGRVAEVPSELDGGNITQDTARLAVSHFLHSKYIAWFLRTPFSQNYFKKVARGVAVKGVNIGDIRPMPIPLCPLNEQQKIVEDIEDRLSVAEVTEQIIDANLARAERLRQGVLGKAFRGELI